ncbi:MAG TPA: hydroxymethylglutaryl-CoA synthase [Candidatus Diapherotrites archaeon]|uniref:Hydroxymethylglutaryl-CoA synthase n=1 Tax=Candidatus Iainarchaeum sp. TaxID=3101447 RepID=A0A7J4JW94_9ARCH|nr:hydroxymethylglutaryl-CoA synthase [Candidatus Diapherotrites archaeon]HIH32743.1 hydroxymethylglutaryl-CoA synthase [Candidatus Diapherotrites archaeon]
MSVGITGYGAYVPKFRIKAESIAEVWGENAERIKAGLGLSEKSVPAKDEDTITISVQAARNALARAGIEGKKIGAIYVGSESHPYAVKPSAVTVGDAIQSGFDTMAADTEFACKAGSAAIQMCAGLVKSEMINYGLAIGADTSQSSPGNALEYSAAAGGAAFIIGREKKEIVAELEKTLSFSSDTPDFWRRGLQAHPEHAGRFTGEPAYFKHVLGASQLMLSETGLKPEDFDFVVFHMPNGKFPIQAAKKLGFSMEQLKPGLVVEKIGNTYSGSSLLGLTAVLDVAKAGQKILVTSYGSGAGSDSFVFTTTKRLEEVQGKAKKTEDYIARKEYLPYAQYRQHMEMIV